MSELYYYGLIKETGERYSGLDGVRAGAEIRIRYSTSALEEFAREVGYKIPFKERLDMWLRREASRLGYDNVISFRKGQS